ncbi:MULTISPECIES: DsbA family protein [Morganellaceae]|nr:thioredoxin domain-containing protein [Proteus mirabilis]MCS6738134.1 DsbA family protein [Proteus mirabilis]
MKKITFTHVSVVALAALTAFTGTKTYFLNADMNEIQIAVDSIEIPKIANDDDLANFFSTYIAATGYKPTTLKTPEQISESNKSTLEQPSPTNDRVYGNINAPFLLIHYSDFECPYCGQGFPELLDFVDSSGGNVALVFKHTLGHGQRSLYLSTLTECAYAQKGNYGFFEVAKFIFDSQRSGGFSTPIAQLASSYSLDETVFQSCVNSNSSNAKILFDTQEAIGLNFDRTPSTIVSYQEKAVPLQGAVPLNEIKAVMGQLTQVN